MDKETSVSNWKEGDLDRRKRSMYQDTQIMVAITTLNVKMDNVLDGMANDKKSFNEHVEKDEITFEKIRQDVIGTRNMLLIGVGGLGGIQLFVTIMTFFNKGH